MQFEWDETKSEKNNLKHGVAFDSVLGFDWYHAAIFADQRHEYGERRFAAFGNIDKRLHVCVYAVRGEFHRIISLRKANSREEKIYEKATQAPD